MLADQLFRCQRVLVDLELDLCGIKIKLYCSNGYGGMALRSRAYRRMLLKAFTILNTPALYRRIISQVLEAHGLGLLIIVAKILDCGIL